MKKITISIALAIASLNAAQAQTYVPVEQKQARFFFGAGFTFGGDKLATANYANGGDVNLRAGGMIAINGGLDYRVTPEFSFQGSIGYHVDQASADNGEIRFQRFPIELLAYYHVAPQWRIGGGARYASSPKLTSSGAGYIGEYRFDNATSGLVEAEYLMSSQVGFKVRLVSEKLKVKRSTATVDGNHIGFLANFYF